MKTVTVRGIDVELSEKLKAAAQADGKSINQVILDTLQKGFGLQKERKFTRIHHDLDHLFGRWSEAEYKTIQGKIDSERTIDPELWQS